MTQDELAQLSRDELVRQSNWQGVKGESPHIQRFSKPE
jgi:hypothetical protein